MTSGLYNGALTTNAVTTTRVAFGLGTMYSVNTPVSVSNGGTNQSSLTLNAVLATQNSSTLVPISGTDGQIIIGANATFPIFANITSSDGSLTITNGSNSLGFAVTQATTSQLGGSLIATNAIALTGTDTTAVIVPSACTAVLAAPPAIGSTTPAAGTFTSINLNTTSGPTITTGSAAPVASAPLGSIYFRTAGSSTVTRAYVNTNGSTTWTALITAA